jgi:hypothetical protein
MTHPVYAWNERGEFSPHGWTNMPEVNVKPGIANHVLLNTRVCAFDMEAWDRYARCDIAAIVTRCRTYAIALFPYVLASRDVEMCRLLVDQKVNAWSSVAEDWVWMLHHNIPRELSIMRYAEDPHPEVAPLLRGRVKHEALVQYMCSSPSLITRSRAEMMGVIKMMCVIETLGLDPASIHTDVVSVVGHLGEPPVNRALTIANVLRFADALESYK